LYVSFDCGLELHKINKKCGKYEDCRVKETGISDFGIGDPVRSEYAVRLLLRSCTFAL